MKRRWIKDRYGDSRRAPMTIIDAVQLILSHTQETAKLIERNPSYTNPHNPDRLPEKRLWSLKVYPRRWWQAAQKLVAEGALVVTHGSFLDPDGDGVFLVAGPQYAQAVRDYLGDAG